ncbi:major facilitator superfamily domain-containing protein, partial [Ilyonectria sp. MPI-CAGE-AT-0026]
NIVSWDGPLDPENLMNWPKVQKCINIGLMSLLTIISPLGSSMFVPGVSKLMKEFNSNSDELSTFVVSIYMFGYAFGPLIFAPLSEIYGRPYLYQIGNLFFVVFCVGAALSNSIHMLMVFRFLMGVVGSIPTTIGVGSIVDTVSLEFRGRAISLWAMGPLLGPSIGPTAGGYLIQAAGWRWVYWFLAILVSQTQLAPFSSLVAMRESYAPCLLQRKAKRLRKETGNPNLRSELDTGNMESMKLAALRPLKFLFATPAVFCIALYVGISNGILSLLIATFSFVYYDKYNFDESQAGLSFLPAGLGMIMGVLTFGHISDSLVRRWKKKHGPGKVYKPEVKVTPWLTIPTGLTLPVGLFIYGWAADRQLHWIVPMIGVFVFSTGLLGATMTLQNYQTDSYSRYASSASAAVTVVRSLVGALMPLSGLGLYTRLGLGWGNSLLGFLSLILIPIPLIL